MAEFSIRTIEVPEWVDDAFDKLEADIKEYKLGEQPFLYDGAKYFHRSFTRYREKEFKENYKRELKTISTQSFLWLVAEEDKDKVSLMAYIEQYFDFVLGEIRKEYIEWETPIPPVDYVWEHYHLGYAPEESVCYWIMELVRNFVVNVHNRFGVSIYDSMIRENSTDAQAETYEDRYYDILYWMYYTYCYKAEEKEFIESKPKNVKRKGYNIFKIKKRKKIDKS